MITLEGQKVADNINQMITIKDNKDISKSDLTLVDLIKFDNIVPMITLSVITLSDFNCMENIYCLDLKEI